MFPVEPVDDERLAFVDVDGAFVHQRRRRIPIDLPDRPRARLRLIENHDRIRRARAQRNAARRILIGQPEIAIGQIGTRRGLFVQQTLFDQRFQQFIGLRKAAELFTRFEGQFKRRAFEVIAEDDQIIGRDEAVLR